MCVGKSVLVRGECVRGVRVTGGGPVAVIVTLVATLAAALATAEAIMAVNGEPSSRVTEAWLSVGEGVAEPPGEESSPQICSSSSTAVDDE